MARRKSYGDITEEQYLKAINWIESGGTKKGACEILDVSNNKIMERLITEFHEGKSRAREMRAKKRKTAVSPSELVEIVMDYLNGYSLVELSDRYYRSTDLIKHHLNKNGAMLRFNGTIDPLNPPTMPDQCFTDEEPKIGEYVWSARYGCVAQVKAKFSNAFRIQIMSKGLQEQAYQGASELGSLKHLEDLGIKLSALEDYMPADEVRVKLAQTMREANKRDKNKG